MVQKYAARLKVARSKFDDFKKEVDALEKTLSVPTPKGASSDYIDRVDGCLLTVKDLRRLIRVYDDRFDDWKRTVKLFR